MRRRRALTGTPANDSTDIGVQPTAGRCRHCLQKLICSSKPLSLHKPGETVTVGSAGSTEQAKSKKLR
jgi:hypothetical protein